MTDAEIIKGILDEPGETRVLEFKRLGTTKNVGIDKTLQSIVAMANTDGGVLVLGVDDPEKTRLKGLDRIFGIEENPTLYDELGQAIKTIQPPLSSIWPPVLVDEVVKAVRVAVLNIPKVTDHFRQVNGHVYVRGEKGNRLLTPHEIVDFAYAKGFERADCQLVKVDFTLLETSFYKSWKKARSVTGESVQEVLEKVGLARRDERGVLLPTRAAVILFAEYPSDLMETKCTIRVSHYDSDKKHVKGDTFNFVSTPKTISGPAVKLIADAQEYVLTLLRSGVRVDSGFVTKYKIPERAIKEAITNAVIHRDYYAKRDIELGIFEDRVEIESPGLLPFNITPSNIGVERATGYRNDLIVKHLREFPEAPNLDQNEGVKVMRDSMQAANLYPPIFWTYPNLEDAVRIVLFNELAPSEWDKVSYYLKKDKFINNRIARHILHIADTSVVSRLLSQWTKQGLLIKMTPRGGSKKYVIYRLPNSADESYLQKLKSNKE